MRFGTPLALADPECVRRVFLYGAWLPEADGCWLAGREAKLVLSLPTPVDTELLLSITASAMVGGPGPRRQRFELRVNGVRAGRVVLTGERPEMHDEGFIVPRAAVAGRDTLAVTMRVPDAISPARAGVDNEDDRSLSVKLQRLALRRPRTSPLGAIVELGGASCDEDVLAGGWSGSEPEGRWTTHARARVLLGLDRHDGPVSLEIDGRPLAADQRVEVVVDGVAAGRLDWDGSGFAPVRIGSIDRARGVHVIELRVREPLAPAALGESDDTRPLGVFVRSLRLVGDAGQADHAPSRA